MFLNDLSVRLNTLEICDSISCNILLEIVDSIKYVTFQWMICGLQCSDLIGNRFLTVNKHRSTLEWG